MTKTSEMRRLWYEHLAGENGEAARSLIATCHDVNDSGLEAAVAFAREAAHYGLRALSRANNFHPEWNDEITREQRAQRKVARKNTPSHYRARLDRLRYRAVFLRERIAKNPGRDFSHNKAEASALEWAVTMLAPWFETVEQDEASAARPCPPESPVSVGSATDPSSSKEGS